MWELEYSALHILSLSKIFVSLPVYSGQNIVASLLNTLY